MRSVILFGLAWLCGAVAPAGAQPLRHMGENELQVAIVAVISRPDRMEVRLEAQAAVAAERTAKKNLRHEQEKKRRARVAEAEHKAVTKRKRQVENNDKCVPALWWRACREVFGGLGRVQAREAVGGKEARARGQSGAAQEARGE